MTVGILRTVSNEWHPFHTSQTHSSAIINYHDEFQ